MDSGNIRAVTLVLVRIGRLTMSKKQKALVVALGIAAANLLTGLGAFLWHIYS